MISIILPIPPSTNKLYRAVGKWPRHRVIKSAEYRDWITEAGLRLNQQHPGSIKGRVTVEIACGGNVDVDNRTKAVLDLLKLHGVIENDSPKFVRECSSRHDDSIEGCRVTVRPFEPRGSRAISDILHGDA